MAKENGTKSPSATDKGKGKAVEEAEKPEDVKKDKDGKPILNGDKPKDGKANEVVEGKLAGHIVARGILTCYIRRA